MRCDHISHVLFRRSSFQNRSRKRTTMVELRSVVVVERRDPRTSPEDLDGVDGLELSRRSHSHVQPRTLWVFSSQSFFWGNRFFGRSLPVRGPRWPWVVLDLDSLPGGCRRHGSQLSVTVVVLLFVGLTREGYGRVEDGVDGDRLGSTFGLPFLRTYHNSFV